MSNTGGDKTKRVNAQSYEIFIATVSNQWLYVQEADLTLDHLEQIEPTTGGSNVPYSGTPRNQLSGTLLFTSDQWSAAVAGWTVLTTKSNNEYPIFTLLIKTTDASGTAVTRTFTSGAKVKTYRETKPAEGAVKVNFTIIMWIDPVIS